MIDCISTEEHIFPLFCPAQLPGMPTGVCLSAEATLDMWASASVCVCACVRLCVVYVYRPCLPLSLAETYPSKFDSMGADSHAAEF